jgi:hypothetical protein
VKDDVRQDLGQLLYFLDGPGGVGVASREGEVPPALSIGLSFHHLYPFEMFVGALL